MVEAHSARAPGVFISYRRDDNSRWARRLAPLLRQRVGEHRVSLDIDFDTGRDWREQIQERLAAAAVVVVLVGPDFLSVRDDTGHPRIEDDDDQVRMEIRSALLVDKVIMPVLTDRATALEAHQLPADIRPLAYLQTDHLDNTEDLDRICDRIERRLITGEDRPGPVRGPLSGRYLGGRRTPLHRDAKEIRNIRTAALQELISAGWLIGSQAGDMVAENDRYPGYHFRFDPRKPVLWLEEDVDGNPRAPTWKRVKSFGLAPDTTPKKSEGLEISALASAATNPGAYLGREGKTTFGGAGVAIAKMLHRPPTAPGQLRDLLESNRLQTTTEIEQRARAAEGRRKAAVSIGVTFAHDIDLGLNRVTGMAFGRSDSTLAIACDLALFVVDATATEVGAMATAEFEASITRLCWADLRLALGLADGEVILFDPRDGSRQQAPHLDADWRRLTEGQQLAHSIGALDVRGDCRMLVYSCAQIPLAVWLPDENQASEITLPKRTEARQSPGWDLDDLWDNVKETTGERLSNWAGAAYKGNYRLTLDPRGPALAIGEQWGDEILIFDPRRPAGGRSIQTDHGVNDLVYSPDGGLLATAERAARVGIIPVDRPEDRRQLTAHDPIAAYGIGENEVLEVTFSPDGRFLASVGEDKNVILWRTADWSPCAVIELSWHGRLPRRGPWLAWSRDSEMLAVPWEGSRVRLFRVDAAA